MSGLQKVFFGSQMLAGRILALKKAI